MSKTTSPVDALVILNAMYRAGGAISPLPAEVPDGAPMLDVNADGSATALDALIVINRVLPEGEPDPELSVSARINAAESLGAQNLLTAADVESLLDRAVVAHPSDDAIIAVVDRGGQILGVRVEGGVSTAVTSDPDALAFAIDGAVAKARTAAFFSSNAAPLPSRTVRFISQSTVTQREVQAAPMHEMPEYQGPGFVAPIGVGGHFPPEVSFTPQVDLFAIEHQSRDSSLHAGLDGVKGTVDDFELINRFNVDLARVPDALESAFDVDVRTNATEDFLTATDEFFGMFPESYGLVTGTSIHSQSRGIATLPGGVPLYKLVTDEDGLLVPGLRQSESINLVGGIGVFFPGEDGFATHEQGFVAGVGQTEKERTNAEKVLQSEYIALIAAAGLEDTSVHAITGASAFVRDVDRFNEVLPKLPAPFVVPNGRIDLVGITLEIFGPTPDRAHPYPGIDRLLKIGDGVLPEIGSVELAAQLADSVAMSVNDVGDLYLPGKAVPQEWLVAPTDSKFAGGLSAAEVETMIAQGIEAADLTRAAIRLDLDNGFRPGARTRMVLAVADTDGTVLGLYRMPDATIFSIDVAIAKARNTNYYANPDAFVDADRIDFNWDGLADVATGDSVPVGTALTNRTFRFLVEPRYPTGIELPGSGTVDGLLNDASLDLCDQRLDLCLLIGPQSILRMPGIDPRTAENIDPASPLPVGIYRDPGSLSVLAFDAFNPGRNFRDPGDDSIVVEGPPVDQGPLASTQLANQNGIVFFPGSAPLYEDGTARLIGGLGVSGDGVDQDDVVTAASQLGFEPNSAIRVDEFLVASGSAALSKIQSQSFWDMMVAVGIRRPSL